MTILLYKDGKLIVDAEQPLEGVSLDNLAAILSGASDGDVIQYDATKGMWVNKSAPSSLPEVTASDKGKYLKANESTGDPEWASGGSSGGGVLVVHEEESGALDKTYAEIKSASNNRVVILNQNGDILYSSYIGYDSISSAYGVAFFGSESTSAYYEADAEDKYPVRADE